MTVEHPGGRIPRPIGPTPREADEVNRGTGRPKTARRATDSRLLRLVAVLGAAVGVLQIGHKVDSRIPDVPGVYDGIRDALGNLESQTAEDKHPDVFDINETPRLTYRNTVGVAKTDFSPDIQHRIVALPIPFEINDQMSVDFSREESGGIKNAIVFSNIPKGTIILAPTSGKYSYDKTIDLLGKAHTLVSIRFLETPGRFRNLIFSLGESTTLIPGIKQVSEQGVVEYKTETDAQAGQALFTVGDGELGISISQGAGDTKTGGAAYENGTPIVSSYELSIQAQGDKAVFVK